MTKDTFLSNYTEIRPVVSVSKFVCVCVCVCVGEGGGGWGWGGGLLVCMFFDKS